MGKEKSHRFNGVLERSTNRLWGAHVRVPDKIAKTFAGMRERRIVCSIAGSEELHRALLPVGKGVYAVAVNKPLREKLGLEIGDTVTIQLRKDTSAFGMPFPEELGEAFRQDPNSAKLFRKLTMGKQRALLYIVSSGRTPLRRAERAVVILRHLAANGGAVNYRQLNAQLKVRASRMV